MLISIKKCPTCNEQIGLFLQQKRKGEIMGIWQCENGHRYKDIKAKNTMGEELQSTNSIHPVFHMKSDDEMKFGTQEPPQDYRIFNKRQENGLYRPLSEFFEGKSDN